MPRLRKARALRRGGCVAVVAPAAAVDLRVVEGGIQCWQDAGFRVKHRDDLGARSTFLAGDDVRRAQELMDFVADPEVGAILCARGGYGSQRILSRLDAERIRDARKALVGYSDITALLLWQRRAAGLMGFHAPMLERGGDYADGEFEALVDALCGEETLPLRRPGNAGSGGVARGRLVGGSLTTVLTTLGTPWEVDTRGAILLLEEVGERPYRLDRMLEQLRLAGKLDAVRGVGLGSFRDCDEPGGALCGDEIVGAWLERLEVPWVRGLPFGHASPNLPWPLGARAELHGDRAELRIVERGVSKA